MVNRAAFVITGIVTQRERFFDRHFVSRAIYGSISVLAVLLVMEEHPPSAFEAVLTLFGTTLAIALAEAYSETIAEVIAKRKRLSREEIKALWVQTRPVLLSANLPTLVLLGSLTGLYSVPSALEVAEYAIYLELFVLGFGTGRLLHGSVWRSLLIGLSTLAIGVLIGLIKYVFH